MTYRWVLALGLISSVGLFIWAVDRQNFHALLVALAAAAASIMVTKTPMPSCAVLFACAAFALIDGDGYGWASAAFGLLSWVTQSEDSRRQKRKRQAELLRKQLAEKPMAQDFY